MPRHKLRNTTRYHHLKDIPVEYQTVLFSGELRYTSHALNRYASRVQPLVTEEGSRPESIDTTTMRLLAADVVDGVVVMQVWRVPLEGHEQDLVLAVSDLGRVATVWVVARDDMDGIWRPKSARPVRQVVDSARGAVPDDDAAALLWAPTAARRRAALRRESTSDDRLGLKRKPIVR